MFNECRNKFDGKQQKKGKTLFDLNLQILGSNLSSAIFLASPLILLALSFLTCNINGDGCY